MQISIKKINQSEEIVELDLNKPWPRSSIYSDSIARFEKNSLSESKKTKKIDDGFITILR